MKGLSILIFIFIELNILETSRTTKTTLNQEATVDHMVAMEDLKVDMEDLKEVTVDLSHIYRKMKEDTPDHREATEDLKDHTKARTNPLDLTLLLETSEEFLEVPKALLGPLKANGKETLMPLTPPLSETDSAQTLLLKSQSIPPVKQQKVLSLWTEELL